MGAADWAGDTATALTEAFDIAERRARRITTLVRMFVSDPAYEAVLADHGTDRRREQQRDLISNLPETLADQPGATVEERWNALMDDRGIPARTGAPVYLSPLADVTDADPTTTSASVSERPGGR